MTKQQILDKLREKEATYTGFAEQCLAMRLATSDFTQKNILAAGQTGNESLAAAYTECIELVEKLP